MSEDVKVDGELTARVGELRRLTFMYCDIVGSTELSVRQEPETFRELMRGYRDACREVIEQQFEGHILRVKGDGALSIFGFPVAHENDAERAVRASLALVRAVHELSAVTTATTGEPLEVRIGVHHGPVYLDFGEDDIYGLAANVGARLEGLADPGTVLVSEEVRQLVEDGFELEAREPQLVKGVNAPLKPFRVIGVRPAPVHPARSPLVERDEQLARVREAWETVSGGARERTVAVLIRGDAGLGKTRLVDALVQDVDAQGGHVVRLSGSPFHANVGFSPVRALIEGRCGIGEDTPATERLESLTRELQRLELDDDRLVRLLAPVLGIAPSAGYQEAGTEGRKLEEEVAAAAGEYLRACIGRQRTLLVAEDLHWFDEATRDLLAELVRAGPRTLLVLGSSRRQEQLAWEAIELAPLTDAGRLALIDALGEGLEERERLALAKRSDGVPLYLEELVRAGPLGSPPLGTPVPVPGSVPAALYEPLVARLYSTPAALPLAATAAAAGQETDLELLATVMSTTPEELAPALRALVDAQVLETTGADPPRYRFRHELLREVAYELQPASWRRRIHDRLCDSLTSEGPGDWPVLALHCERAERHREAALAHQNAGEWARRRGALAEARSHLTRAIDLMPQIEDPAARDRLEVKLRLRRGFLAMTSEGMVSAQAAADFDRCLELAAADPTGDVMFATLISIWAYYLCRADLGRAREISERQRPAPGGGRAWFRPQNLGGLGMLDWFEGQFTDATAKLGNAADDLDREDVEEAVAAMWFVPNDHVASIHTHLALGRFMLADLTGADESLARARARAAALDFPQGPWSGAYATWLGSWMWMEAGRLDTAEAELAELLATTARHGFDSWSMVAATHSATLAALVDLRSRTAGAEVLREHAETLLNHIELWQALGVRIFLPFYITTAGALLAVAGERREARRLYQESLALASETGMRFYDAETLRRAAHLGRGRADRVRHLRKALDLARSQAARPFELRTALDLYEIQGDEARPLLEQAMRAFDDRASSTDLEAARAA